MSAAGSTSFPREAIEACLDRIAASPPFSRSLRLGRFLRFTVEALLEGRVDGLKERSIGVEVYGRALEYDPRTDPIVRSEAHRLRRRLTAYYEREGSADPIVIEIPKGSYVPELRPNTSEPGRGLGDCRLIVADFEDRSPRGRNAAQADVMVEALRARLAGWPGLRVLHRVSGAGGSRRDSAHLVADYRVEGAFERSGGHCAVTVRLLRLADEKAIASETERFAWKQLGGVAEVLAGRLAASIGAALTRRTHSSPPAADHRLRAALLREPQFVDALAELAHLELMRLYPPRDDRASVLASARALLERALAAEPRHARSLSCSGTSRGTRCDLERPCT